MTGPQSSNILNIWAGYCSSPEKIDIGYLKNIDGTVVPEIAGYEFVYLDPTSVLAAGPIEMTAWYRPSIFTLIIYYKNIVNGSDIYPSLQLIGLQSALTTDREFMENNGYLPDIVNFFYDHFELNVIPGSNEGILNVW